MSRRYLFSVLASAALIFSTAILAHAQMGQLRGKAVLKNADGTTRPIGDVSIVVYRVDLPGRYENKSDKRGVFVFAGLPFVGTYIITASAPGAEPTWIPGVKVGQGVDYEIDMSPGNGRVYSAEDIKTIMAMAKNPATAGGGGAVKESAEEKAKREELEKKNAEIMEKNKKAEASNATIQQAFKAGNEALKAKNYDEAIVQYDSGLRSDPDHPGAPSLLTNKASAQNTRAVNRYNAAIQSKDDATKAAGIEAAKKDWKEAYEASKKAVEMLKSGEAPADATAMGNAKTNLYFALLIRAEASRFYVSKLDPKEADAGIAAYTEYMAVETDAAKKLEAQRGLANMLFDANDFDRSLVEYRKILESNPDDLDALLRSGQALFNIGAMNNSDKVKYQEAANYLAQFVSKAPDTNPFKEDAKAILETLKAQENVKPVAAPRRPRRP